MESSGRNYIFLDSHHQFVYNDTKIQWYNFKEHIVLMTIKLDFRSAKPIYAQIVDQIKHMIASGELKPGDQLPPVRELAADLQVNFNTIARAYRMLDEAGTLSTQHGRGTYILEPPFANDADDLPSDPLEALTRHYLAVAIHLGYRLKEVSAAFERTLASHQKGDQTISGTQNIIEKPDD